MICRSVALQPPGSEYTTIPVTMFRMSCPTARTLFEDYSYATMEHSEATGKLSTLVGRHEEFAEAKKHCDEMSAKCRTARRVLEQHWEEHGCRARESSTDGGKDLP